MADALGPVWRSRTQRRGGVLCALILAGVGFLPLFGGPSYEAALALGLLLPSLTACVVALEIADRGLSAQRALARGVLTGCWLSLIALGVTTLHGARVGFCEPGGDYLLLLLGPCCGALLGGVWGAGCALFGERLRRWRKGSLLVLCVLGPGLGIFVSLVRFFTSPIVFAFDPFFGYFAGPIYDTVLGSLDRLFQYRLGSALTLLAAALIALHLDRVAPGRFQMRSIGRPGLFALGVAAALGSLLHSAYGAELGHWQTSASIRRALGHELASKRCDVIHSGAILERDARLLAEECDAHLSQIEGYFEARGPERVRVYLFANPDEKGRLMGAATTYIAKPWRAEIYIQFRRYPHSVLGHELAHVVSGSFGQGPFRVAGPLGGLIPDPGRIEGVATAASPDEEDLSLAEWSRAMQKLAILPPLRSVFRLSFLGENSSKAYTVAGAFISYFRQRYGATALRAWYGGASLESLSGGKSIDDLDREWQEQLRKISISPRAMATARLRFERPAIFGRKCPHVVDALLGRANGELSGLDCPSARQHFDQVLRLDPGNFGARLGLASCELRQGNQRAARERLGDIASDATLTPLYRARAEEQIADIDLALGNAAEATRRYRKIAELVVDEDHLRTLEVKRDTADPLARDAIATLLVGDLRLGPDFASAAAKLGRWAEARPDAGVPEYLLGRNLYNHGRYRDAAEYLRIDRLEHIESPLVRREAWRVALTLACAQKDRPSAARAYRAWLEEPGVSAARRDSVRRLAERCGVRP